MPEIDLGSVVGPQGPQGATGPTGPQGEQGPQGETGEAGKSAYQAAKDGGYTGTEAEFNAILAIINAHAGRHRTGGADPLTAADVGAAPAGFGLGETTAQSFSDANLCTKSGLYADHAGAAENVPVNGGLLRVSAWTKSYIVQELFNQGKITSVREYHSSTGWSEWEYINPPMQLGVEYRTTERYIGKPVYCKLVDCGLSMNGKKSVDSGITNAIVVRREAVIDNQYVSPHIWKDDDSYSVLVDTVKDAGKIYFVIFSGENAVGLSVYSKIWYCRN